MPITFIHAADLHLDSPLRGLAAYEEAPVDRLRGAARRAFSKLVEEAIARKVAFLVLAGDIWDGDWPDVRTGLYFAAEMGRLERAGIPVYMIRGNHDAESRITRAITLPENVHIFSAKQAETVRLEEHGVALQGRSFARPDESDNLALGYPDALPDCRNIGILHTALEGDANHATYAPCRLAELQAKGYDYWALGHVHAHSLLATGANGAEGGTIAFPGVLQGRHAREIGPKGALLVEIGEQGIAVERLIVDVVRWFDLELEVSGSKTHEDVIRLIGACFSDLLARADAPPEERLPAVRLTLTGRTPLHGELAIDRRRLREEALGQIAAIAQEGIFLEKLRLRTHPGHTAEEIERRQDALAELQGLLAGVADDGSFIEATLAQLRERLEILPPEVREALQESETERLTAIREGRLEAILPELRAGLIDYLAKA
jgi:DNA repair exonuclease SbcCD nuclease subunit